MTTKSISLKKLHTFALPVCAEQVIYAETAEQLVAAWLLAKQQSKPFLLLGEGSNALFLSDFAGIVVFNRITGVTSRSTDDSWHLHVGAGENWHKLVTDTLTWGMTGLENLALIPGCVGSAPIQNIGAYGVELKNICEYVDLLDLTTGKTQRILASDCEFGYRESIFKHAYRDGYAIIAVGLRLPKHWQPVLSYGDLRLLDKATVTVRQVFDSVCAMRRAKLPDPAVTGNAGSFFKNPVVSAELAQKIVAAYPDMPVYPQADGSVKLAAGWLIDQCHLKGFAINGAAVHHQQALVLINQGPAISADVVALARHVRQQVAERFGVWLEPEVRFIDSQGERDALEILK